jgi:2-dehydropantoate 2-reductase
MEIKTVSLIGLGAIGAYLAKGISTAIGNDSFQVIADGDRKRRIENEGVVINGTPYSFNVVSPEEDVKPSDLVVVITKFNQLRGAALQIRKFVGPDTIIMAPLNGIESEDILAEYYPQEQIIYSLARVASLREGNKITYSENLAYIEFGEKTNETISPRVQAIADMFDKGGIGYKIQPDMLKAIWTKFMCNCSENQSSAVLGIPFGAWHNNVHANYIREAIMKEVITIAQAKGIDLTLDALPVQQQLLLNVSPTARTSTLQDIENGRKTEVEMFSGAIMRLGKELDVPTPINEIFYHAIKTLEDKNDGAFDFSPS